MLINATTNTNKPMITMPDPIITIPSTRAELGAMRDDARRHRAELLAALRALWTDRDDALVISEITAMFDELRACEHVLAGGDCG
jgi:hypothetical protein